MTEDPNWEFGKDSPRTQDEEPIQQATQAPAPEPYVAPQTIAPEPPKTLIPPRVTAKFRKIKHKYHQYHATTHPKKSSK